VIFPPPQLSGLLAALEPGLGLGLALGLALALGLGLGLGLTRVEHVGVCEAPADAQHAPRVAAQVSQQRGCWVASTPTPPPPRPHPDPTHPPPAAPTP
jgi:hypothetical protein